MFPTSDSTRDLLPPIAADPDDIIGPEMPFAGNVLPSVIPQSSYPSAPHAAAELPPGEQVGGAHEGDFDGSFATAPLEDLAPSGAAPHFSTTFVKDPEGSHFIPVSAVQHPSMLEPPATGEGGGSHNHPASGQVSSSETDGDGVRGSVDLDDAGYPLSETDDAQSISVRQIAIVDQDASVFVSGYLGEVVARLHIDQDLLMDQEVEVNFTIDGDGHFNLLLDQEVRIDQNVQIDLEIYDTDGVLYIYLFLHDAVEVEQETTVDMRISDGPHGGTVDVSQDIEITQDVDIDIDIEDDLEERYIVKVEVETLQRAEVDQDVVVDVREWNGEIDMNVDAGQTATVDQQTIVQADFVLV